MENRKYLAITFLSILLIIQLTPVPVRAWAMIDSTLSAVDFKPGTQPIKPLQAADLDRDGRNETLLVKEERLSILSWQKKVWESPEEWGVIQSAFTDLNQDGLIEVSLLVWRPHRPWPVDEFLPYGGVISGFQDRQGNSCQMILIGWINHGYDELWAGSALADPIKAFAAIDLDDDTDQELVTLEGVYSRVRSSQARTLKVWEWNGFGFSVVSYVESTFSDLVLMQEENGKVLILTP